MYFIEIVQREREEIRLLEEKFNKFINYIRNYTNHRSCWGIIR